MDTSVYKLAEFNSPDLQYIEGVFIWLNAKVFSFNWDERHNLEVIEVHYVIVEKY
jgi:hypothetical protein